MSSRLLVLALLLVACAAQPNWMFQTPGGETSCAHGDPYSFFWKPGTNNHLTVFFEGGGACWDEGSCLLPIYTTTVDVDQTMQDLQSRAGFLVDPRSAIYNDTILYLPYCTGDVHVGTQLSSYLVAHVGRKNVEAGLSFIQSTIQFQPEQVTVAGCSAGSLGAFINAPFVFNRFPNAKYKVWGDSEVGIVSPAQWEGAFNNWKIQLPPWIPGLADKFTRAYRPSIAGYIISQVAMYYPHAQVGAYTSDYDAVQSGFYLAGGGTQDWTSLMRDQFSQIMANTTTRNVGYYIGGGSAHCQNDDDAFFSDSSNGVLLYQWVNALVTSDPSFQPVVDCAPNCSN